MSEAEASASTSSSNGQAHLHQNHDSALKRKYNMTATEQQALQLQKLLANPDKEVYIPNATKEKELRAPREQMKNVSGSSAGAGSGEFHVYKHSRRREYERIKLMEEKAKREEEKFEYEKRQKTLQEQASSKTNKNRLKREKKKEAKSAAKEAIKSHVGSKPDGAAKDTSTIADSPVEEDQAKRKRINAEGTAQVIFRRKQDDDSDD